MRPGQAKIDLDVMHTMIREGKSNREISARFNVTPAAISQACDRNGIARPAKAAPKGRPNRAQGKAVSPCAHPGCRKTIREGTWNFATGFCLDHQPVKKAPVRENVRQVRVAEIAYPTSNSGVCGRDKVSLPKEPWL